MGNKIFLKDFYVFYVDVYFSFVAESRNIVNILLHCLAWMEHESIARQKNRQLQNQKLLKALKNYLMIFIQR